MESIRHRKKSLQRASPRLPLISAYSIDVSFGPDRSSKRQGRTGDKGGSLEEEQGEGAAKVEGTATPSQVQVRKPQEEAVNGLSLTALLPAGAGAGEGGGQGRSTQARENSNPERGKGVGREDLDPCLLHWEG